MQLNKLVVLVVLIIISTGCNNKEIEINEEIEEKKYSELLNSEEALELFEEGMEATVYDIETGLTFNVRRIEGGFDTLADVETLSLEDTNTLLETAGGNWSIIRRAVIVTIGEFKIAASIAPFEHSGDESYEYGEIIDNRSGQTGTGINLDSIRDNGMTGVVDIYFYNSLVPGINRIDERHQEMVLKAYEYEG